MDPKIRTVLWHKDTVDRNRSATQSRLPIITNEKTRRYWRDVGNRRGFESALHVATHPSYRQVRLDQYQWGSSCNPAVDGWSSQDSLTTSKKWAILYNYYPNLLHICIYIPTIEVLVRCRDIIKSKITSFKTYLTKTLAAYPDSQVPLDEVTRLEIRERVYRAREVYERFEKIQLKRYW